MVGGYNGTVKAQSYIPDLLDEIERLQYIEDGAIKQSEEVQNNWLSPAEAHGLRAEIASLKLQIKAIEEDFGA